MTLEIHSPKNLTLIKLSDIIISHQYFFSLFRLPLELIPLSTTHINPTLTTSSFYHGN